MKLLSPFVQLPLMFDAQRLAQEVGRIEESAWLPHPQGFPGNDYLALVSVRGDPNNDNFQGQMRSTPHLDRCPYLIDVLASLGVSLGRTRLMRLLGHAEVTPHVDVHYYWRDRMRVHVPIVTQPTVRFICGPQEVNMKEGECWIFDTWSKHRVINDAEKARIHLVVDTVGGEKFWDLAVRGRVPGNPTPNWTARAVSPFGASTAQLDFEQTNIPKVMSPWEIKDHATFLLGEMDQSQPAFAATSNAFWQFHHTWRSLWSTFGESREGWPRYRRALDAFITSLRNARADTLQLRNAYGFSQAINAAVIGVALADRDQDDGSGESRDASGTREAPTASAVTPSMASRAATRDGPDRLFDRPIFIVNPPRSGSTLLFETLAKAPFVYTIGDESHELIEGMPALSIGARNWSSNRLDAADATPEVTSALRARFAAALRDREGNRPPHDTRVRMLEKTPKNALRIPFLASVFPEARFVYLYREPREVLSSMMEAWRSGRFRTYPGLPGWRGELPWSLLLTPGWSDLAALPLSERVALQWATATNILLEDLSSLPRDRWTVARYDELVRDPGAEVMRICEAIEFGWDRPLGPDLPLSRYTVSKPRADKWREQGAEVEAALRRVADIAARAERLAAR